MKSNDMNKLFSIAKDPMQNFIAALKNFDHEYLNQHIVEIKNEEGWTLLHVVAERMLINTTYKDKFSLLKIMQVVASENLTQIINMNLTDHWTFLHQVVVYHDNEVFYALLDKTNTDNIKDVLLKKTNQGNALLDLAVHARRIEKVKTLYQLMLKYFSFEKIKPYLLRAIEIAKIENAINMYDFLKNPPDFLDLEEIRRVEGAERQLVDGDSGEIETSSRLSKVEVNQLIQSKFCKVVSEYGEGTGFFIDDEEGLLLTSFHLIGSIKRAKLQVSGYPNIMGKLFIVMQHLGYIDSESYFTQKALEINDVSELNLDLQGFTGLVGSFEAPDPQTKVAKKYNITISREDQSWLESFRPKIFAAIREGADKKNVVYSQDIVEIIYRGERLKGRVYVPDDKNDFYLHRNYAFLDVLPIKILAFEDGTPFSRKTRMLNSGERIREIPADVRLEIGETVYFGGYPLTQDEYSFGKGIISSFIVESQRRFVVIDASIAPGNSGGPVFVQRNGRVYFIGVITSEVARVSEKMHELRDEFRQQKPRMRMQVGGFDVYESVGELTQTLMDNLSTGKGKAILIPRIAEIFTRKLFEEELLGPSFLDFLVPKPKPKPTFRPLYEWINEKKIRWLTLKDIITYIRECSDEKTHTAIFSIGKICKENLLLKNYIIFNSNSLTRDPEMQEIENKIKVAGLSVNDIKYWFKSALCVSQKQIIDGQFRFEANRFIPVYPNSKVTLKFFEDHVGGGNQNVDRGMADATAERRGSRFPISSVISGQSLDALNEEVNVSQNLYRQCESLALLISQTDGKILWSLCFLTLNAFQMQVRSRQGRQPSHTRSRFFYSVIQKDGQYYMHHFAASENRQSPEWQKLDLSAAEEIVNPEDRQRTVYYQLAERGDLRR